MKLTPLKPQSAAPGSVEFVSRTTAVCEDLPTVAIPSNGLLYTIARRLFLNSLRGKSAGLAMFAVAVADEAQSPGLLTDWDIDYPLDAQAVDAGGERRDRAGASFR